MNVNVPDSRRCLCAASPSCRGDATPRCPACARRLLRPHRERHARARDAHSRAKSECARALEQRRSRLNELQCESQRLRDELSALRKRCGDLAVRVASRAVENDAVKEQLSKRAHGASDHVARLRDSVLTGSLATAQHTTSTQVRMLRFQWARKAMHMHRLDVGSDAESVISKQNQLSSHSGENEGKDGRQRNQRRAQGIGKIGGLPLPHAGPELYGVLPPLELQSALRLVASVTSIVARCLGIVLPHPILLTPNGHNGDIIETVSPEELRKFQDEHKNGKSSQNNVQPHQPVGSSSTSSLMSIMDSSLWKRSAKNALARATGQQLIVSSTANTFVPPSMDAELVSQRLQHASAAILSESTDAASSSKFSLSMEGGNGDQEGFAIALQFLQNDIITLCIRAGVPVAKLWPAEAVLLNLRALMIYCEEQTAAPY